MENNYQQFNEASTFSLSAVVTDQQLQHNAGYAVLLYMSSYCMNTCHLWCRLFLNDFTISQFVGLHS